MSGPAPETERERQLRELAGRLLHWPDPEGPVTADLLPVGYPDDLPKEIVDRTELRFAVTSAPAPGRPRPEIPRYLAERLADLDSLRAEGQGFSFAFENRTRPAVLSGITGLRLDGVVVTGHQLQIETNAGLGPLPKRLDLPLGRRLVVHILSGEPLGAGAHSVEADITVPGIASGRLVIENGANQHGGA